MKRRTGTRSSRTWSAADGVGCLSVGGLLLPAVFEDRVRIPGALLGWGEMKTRDKCFECGQSAMHRHHVVPRSLGGRNTVWLCESCHGLVHGADLRTSALTSKAMKRIAARGGRVGRYPHFGYRLTRTGKMAADESEQAVIREIVQMTQLGKSPAEICRIMNSSGSRCRYRTWRVAMVEKILNRQSQRNASAFRRRHLKMRQMTIFDRDEDTTINNSTKGR